MRNSVPRNDKAIRYENNANKKRSKRRNEQRFRFDPTSNRCDDVATAPESDDARTEDESVWYSTPFVAFTNEKENLSLLEHSVPVMTDEFASFTRSYEATVSPSPPPSTTTKVVVVSRESPPSVDRNGR